MMNNKIKQTIKPKFETLHWDNEYSESFLKEKFDCEKINNITDEQAEKAIKELDRLILIQGIKYGSRLLSWSNETLKDFLKENSKCEEIDNLTYEQAEKVISELEHLVLLQAIEYTVKRLRWSNEDLNNFLKENFKCEKIDNLTYEQACKAIKELARLMLLQGIKWRAKLLRWNNEALNDFLKENSKCEEIDNLTYEQADETIEKLDRIILLQGIKYGTKRSSNEIDYKRFF